MSTVSVQMCQFIVAGAAQRGVQPNQLLAQAGLRAEQLTNPDGRLPRESEVRLWEAAVRLSQDTDLGLHMAAQLNVGILGGLGFAVRSSATLGEAYERVARYLSLVNQDIELQIVRLTDGLVALRHVPPTTLHPPRQAIECFMALLYRVGQLGIGSAFAVSALHLRHAKVLDITAHQQLFGVSPRFAAEHDELILPRPLLAARQREAEPELGTILDRHLQDMLRQLPPKAGFLDQVRAALLAELKRGELSVTALAQRLHMSPRSLQRRLQQEQTTIKDLFTTLRHELAVRHLRERQESIAEIAFLLGFSEPSTFHRAFKRWTGMTPAQFRGSAE
jgi:AraC-like DNA-binding protein